MKELVVIPKYSMDYVIDRIKMFNNTCESIEYMYQLRNCISNTRLITLSTATSIEEREDCYIVSGLYDSLVSFTRSFKDNIFTTETSVEQCEHVIRIPKFVLDCSNAIDFMQDTLMYITKLDWENITDEML